MKCVPAARWQSEVRISRLSMFLGNVHSVRINKYNNYNERRIKYILSDPWKLIFMEVGVPNVYNFFLVASFSFNYINLTGVRKSTSLSTEIFLLFLFSFYLILSDEISIKDACEI